uniref:Putative secreted protein n=1 Tax=Xenopsylla cheopis TaxID=163159 RepID=A0A6M2DKJ4_XENCH
MHKLARFSAFSITFLNLTLNLTRKPYFSRTPTRKSQEESNPVISASQNCPYFGSLFWLFSVLCFGVQFRLFVLVCNAPW